MEDTTATLHPCGLGAKNEEQESKTVRKMGHFLALVPFFARPKLKIPFLVVPWSFFAPSQTETLATQATCASPVRQSERARALLVRKGASAFSSFTIMLACLSRLKFPFPFLSNAYHADYCSPYLRFG